MAFSIISLLLILCTALHHGNALNPSLYSGGDDLSTQIGGFNRDGKIAILTVHNTFRSNIALGNLYIKADNDYKQSASNMRKLVWNNSLELSAQSWANKCIYDLSGSQFGENLYQETSNSPLAITPSVVGTSRLWSEIVQNIGWSSNFMTNDLFNTGIGATTEMAWANSMSLGCGVSLCNSKRILLVVCHYYEGGNWIDENVYEEGTPCSHCPTSTTCNTVLGLCETSGGSVALTTVKSTTFRNGGTTTRPTQTPTTKTPGNNGSGDLISGGDDLNVIIGAFNREGKIGLLSAHNSLRSQIAMGKYYINKTNTWKPQAANMYKILWNNTIERSAQIYANKCIWAHSNLGYGENLYQTYSTQVMQFKQSVGTYAVAAWIKEFQLYGWDGTMMTNSLFASGVGHATQVAWALTRYMGCGASMCNNNKQIIVVCQYSIPGNMNGASIYQPGSTCSACPVGSFCDRSIGLCV